MAEPVALTNKSFDHSHFNRQAEVLDIVMEHITQGMVVVGRDYQVLAFNRPFIEILQLPVGAVQVGADFRHWSRYGRRSPARTSRCWTMPSLSWT